MEGLAASQPVGKESDDISPESISQMLRKLNILPFAGSVDMGGNCPQGVSLYIRGRGKAQNVQVRRSSFLCLIFLCLLLI